MQNARPCGTYVGRDSPKDMLAPVHVNQSQTDENWSPMTIIRVQSMRNDLKHANPRLLMSTNSSQQLHKTALPIVPKATDKSRRSNKEACPFSTCRQKSSAEAARATSVPQPNLKQDRKGSRADEFSRDLKLACHCSPNLFD